MKSLSQSDIKINSISIRDIALIPILAVLMFVSQIALAVIPNVELVSFLVIIYTLVFGKKVFLILYIFVMLQGFTYGFGLWFLNYTYIWAILSLITLLFRKVRSPIAWAVISGTFGLFFGMLCAIPYLFIGGWTLALAYWLSGISFDITHCIANFIICLILFIPFYTLFNKLQNTYQKDFIKRFK